MNPMPKHKARNLNTFVHLTLCSVVIGIVIDKVVLTPHGSFVPELLEC